MYSDKKNSWTRCITLLLMQITQNTNSVLGSMPYFSVQSIYLRKSLMSTLNLKKINKQLDVSVVFTVPKIERFFSIKDKVPITLRSGVIHKFQCEVDPRRSYIGKTYRHLGQRIKEHRNKLSAIYDHRLNCDCNCNVSNIEIDSRCLICTTH